MSALEPGFEKRQDAGRLALSEAPATSEQASNTTSTLAASLQSDELRVRLLPTNRAAQGGPEHTESGSPAALQSGELRAKIGPQGDVYEREANAVADSVTSFIESRPGGHQPIQRKSGNRAPTQVGAPANLGTGRGLSEAERTPFEAALGQDFSSVRVHEGRAAAGASATIGAEAFTYGNHVVLGENTSTSDSKVMAHELAHVVQQKASSPLAESTQSPQSKTEPRVQRQTAQGARADSGTDITLEEPASVRCIFGFGKKKKKKKKKEEESKKVAHTSGKKADTYIQTELGKTIKNLKTGKVAEDKIQIVANAKFVTEYDRYFGDDGERDITNAFVERDSSKNVVAVWIHEERGSPGTAIHEAIHMYSDTGFISAFGVQANEGATEYFTRIVSKAYSVPERTNYQQNVNATVALVTLSTQPTLADAYFHGKTAELRTAVGATKFDKWKRLMKQKKFTKAIEALN